MTAAALAGVATVTPRADPTGSQDACRALDVDDDGLAAVVVADGVGSLPESGPAARLAVDVVATGLRGDPSASVAGLCRQAHERLREEVAPLGATTLLVLACRGGTVEAHWVGNGAVLVAAETPIRDGGRTVGAELVWSELTLPHVAYADGRDVLDRVLGGDGCRGAQPDGVVLGPGRRARLLLAVTDGIYSAEQVETGVVDGTERWRRLGPRPSAVLDLAAATLAAHRAGGLVRAGQLDALCQQALECLRGGGQLDDDATVGALLVPGADPQEWDALRP